MTPSWRLAATMHFNYGLHWKLHCKMGQHAPSHKHTIANCNLRWYVDDGTWTTWQKGTAGQMYEQHERHVTRSVPCNDKKVQFGLSLALHLNEPLLIVCFYRSYQSATSMSVLRVCSSLWTQKQELSCFSTFSMTCCSSTDSWCDAISLVDFTLKYSSITTSWHIGSKLAKVHSRRLP